MKTRNKILAFCLAICCVITIFSSVAYAESEVTASVTMFDAANKKIIVTVSENVNGTVGRVSLVNTETMEKVGANATVENGKEIVVSYSNDLVPDTEYAIVLEDDVFGVSGNKLSSNYIYFTTDGSLTVTKYDLYDFDTKTITTSVTPAKYYAITDSDATHGKAMKVTASGTNNNQDADFGGITYYGSDRWGISFDVKITKTPASFAVLMFTENSSTPAGFGFTTAKGRVVFMPGSWLDNATLATDIDRWFSNSIIGDWKVGEWVNYKAIYNKNTNKFSIYVNNELKKTVNAAGNFNKISKIRLSLRNQNNGPTVDEEMMWIDNIKVEEYPSANKVNNIRIYDLNGKEYAAPQKIKRDINTIKVDFMGEVDKTSLTTDTVVLKYGDNAVEYTVENTDDDKSFVIKPKNLPKDGDKVSVTVSGAKSKSDGTALPPYTSYVMVDDKETGVSASQIELVNAEGNAAVLGEDSEIYLKTTLVNKTDNEAVKILFVMGYGEDNSLEVLTCKKVTVPAYSAFITDNTQNQIKVNAGDDIVSIMATIDTVDGNILRPFAESVVLTVPTDE